MSGKDLSKINKSNHDLTTRATTTSDPLVCAKIPKVLRQLFRQPSSYHLPAIKVMQAGTSTEFLGRLSILDCQDTEFSK